MSDDLQWFSAKVRSICLLEVRGADRYMDSVHVFRASDWDQAMRKAVALGRAHEQEYTNEEGHRVRWRLKEVVSLDLIPDNRLDGAEVYSEFVPVPPMEYARFDAEFQPEESHPTQTI